MALLSDTNIKNFLDKVAAVIADLDAELGSGSEAGTPSKSAADVLGSIAALTDVDQLRDLLEGAANYAELTKAKTNYPMTLSIIEAIDSHLAGLKAHAIANDFRLHYDLLKIYSCLAGAAIFPPEQLIGTYAVTEASSQSGTYTHSAAVDTAKYGKANAIVKVINQAIGVTDLVLTLTMVKLDATTENKIVTVTGSSTVGTTFDIGTHDSDMYIDCTAVTFTGGNDGDDVEIRTELERSVSM